MLFYTQQKKKNMLKSNNRNTKRKCKVSPKPTKKTQEECQWHRSSVFIVKFEHISHLFIVLLLLTLNMEKFVEYCWIKILLRQLSIEQRYIFKVCTKSTKNIITLNIVVFMFKVTKPLDRWHKLNLQN